MGRLFGKKADKARSRGEILCELQEQCVGAQGICMVGAVICLMFFAGKCWAAANGTMPFLGCVNEALQYLLWGAALSVGARYFGRSSKLGGPFRPESVQELKAISWLVLFSSFVPGMFAWLLGKVLGVFPQTAALVHGAFDFDLVVNFPILWAALVIGAFALIISYGCVLQQQDDGLV